MLLCTASSPASVLLADAAIIRIGTGGSAGTYLPIGNIIATVLSSNTDPALENANHSDAVGMNASATKKMLAIAQRSTGSVSNVIDVNNGLLEAGLAQADVVYRAYHSEGPVMLDQAQENLRGIATLYLESVHLVVRDGTGINGIEDLKGKHVSLDEQGSGTRLVVLSILEAYNIPTSTFKPVYLKTPDAIDRLLNDQLDAFFVVAGYPVGAVSRLVANGEASIVPISGEPADSLADRQPYFSIDRIPQGVYQNEGDIPTLGVPAQLITNNAIDEELVYTITKKLWSDQSMQLLYNGHPKGREVQLDSALVGMDVPLHAGAERFYREAGLLNP